MYLVHAFGLFVVWININHGDDDIAGGLGGSESRNAQEAVV